MSTTYYHSARRTTRTPVQVPPGARVSGVPRRSACSACGALVTWALFPDHVVRPIEVCPDGEGTIALQPALPGIGAPQRIEARIVSGVRTSHRLHIDTCPRAELFRNRWRIVLRCCACACEMVALESGRSVCGPCQAAERAGLDAVADRMVAELGQAEALSLVNRLRDVAGARISRGKR